LEILTYQLSLNKKELEHHLQQDINVLKRKTKLKQGTGPAILAATGNL
jgi:hypothetical protein